jgi:uncharacterized membrane-anchored protein
MTRWNLAVGWVAAQLVFFAGWTAVEERRHTVGDSILVRTAPVDPRDLLSGQYMALSYDFSLTTFRVNGVQEAEEGQPVWVLLRPEGPFHVPDRVQDVRPNGVPSGWVVIVGRRERWRYVYGIEKYFVPEGTSTPSQRDVTVRLRVGRDGVPRIEQVLVRGNPWP